MLTVFPQTSNENFLLLYISKIMFTSTQLHDQVETQFERKTI
jgi:hypothetical protein